ncbi:nSTAND1 domain-containing NTPase [Frankia gtarii]|uniref:nSTAND1 domain-containing NTPase n=1 Tax=Frankia gtarii TaxID=2950102 RepID=UPI0021C07B70|nr:hypothetical protein [Frankia gtarii]
MDYDLNRLGEREFEHLSQALMTAVFKVGVQVFGDGPDGGREASFEGVASIPDDAGGGTWAGYGVLQAKFRRRPDGAGQDAGWFAREVEAELKKWSDPQSGRVQKGRRPELLLLTTNVVLSPAAGTGGADKVNDIVQRYAVQLGVKGWWIWHYDTLCRLLDIHDGVRRTYAGQILPGDVLSQMQDLLQTEPHQGGGAVGWRVRPLAEGNGQGAACPYKGLAAFTEADAGMFFGREQLTARLVDRLSRCFEAGRPLMVIGASGAGKSSALAAGLLPALGRGQLGVPGSAEWPRLLLTPTADPLGALTASLAEVAVQPTEGLIEKCRDQLDGLSAGIRDQAVDPGDGATAARGRVVLVVDQFEELFTQCTDSDARRAFIDALCVAARRSGGAEPPAAVVIGIRADFAAHLAAYPSLREALETRPVFVGPMSPDELRSAIEQPAVAAGLTLESGLVDVVLTELDDRPTGTATAQPGHDVGHLPLLSHALLVTCQRSAGDHLTIAAYHSTGGISRAVASTADEIVGRFDEDHYQTARALLLDLVQIGDGTGDTRRRLSMTRLLGAEDPRRTQRVLAALAAPDARLVTVYEDHVEITHEALLRVWPTLRAWIDSDRSGQRLRQQIEDDAHTWHDDNRDPSHLYRGNRLANALASAGNNRTLAQLSLRAREFLAAARRRARRARQQIIAAVAAVVLLVSGSGITFLVEWRQSVGREEARERAQNATIAEGLIARADTVRSSDVRMSLRLDVAANAIGPGPHPKTDILAALTGTHLAASLTGQKFAVNTVAFAGKKNVLAVGSADGSVILWDTSDPDAPRRLPGPLRGNTGGILAVAFTPDGNLLATAGTGTSKSSSDTTGTTYNSDADVVLWDTSDPTSPRRLGNPLTGQIGNIRGVAFTADAKTLITASTDAKVVLWDIASPAEPRPVGKIEEYDPSGMLAIAVASGSATVAIATYDGARLWDIRDRTRPRRLKNVPEADGSINAIIRDSVTLGEPPVERNDVVDPIWGVAFTPNGSVLATASNHGTILWDVRDPSLPRRLGGPVISGGAGPTAVTFSPDASILATGSGEGTIALWNVRDPAAPAPIATLAAHAKSADAVAFAADGTTLASGSFDTTAALWHVNDPTVALLLPSAQIASKAPMTVPDLTAEPWRPHGEEILQTPDGTTVVQALEEGTVELWDTTRSVDPKSASTLPKTDENAYRRLVDLSPDGTLLVTESFKGYTIMGAFESAKLELWNIGRLTSPRRLFLSPQVAGGDAVASFSGDSNVLAVVGADGKLNLWDTTDRIHPRYRSSPASRLRSTYGYQFSFTADRNTLVLAGGTSKGPGLEIWDISNLTTPKRLAEVTGYAETYTHPMAISPDGKILATVIDNGLSEPATVMLWDLTNKKYPRRIGGALTDAPTGIDSLAFSHDGTILAIEGGFVAGTVVDRTTSFWSVSDPAAATRLNLKLQKVPSDVGVGRISFAPYDATLTAVASGGRPGSLRVLRWDMKILAELSRSVIRYGCQRAGGGLSPAEWERYIPDLPYRRTC